MRLAVLHDGQHETTYGIFDLVENEQDGGLADGDGLAGDVVDGEGLVGAKGRGDLGGGVRGDVVVLGGVRGVKGVGVVGVAGVGRKGWDVRGGGAGRLATKYGLREDQADQLAQEFANALLKEGIYVTGFFYPVVPKGQARIRTQMSADHTPEQIERAVAAFTRIGKDLGVIA